MGTTGEAPDQPSVNGLRERLLAWYEGHRRDLPWRAHPGDRPDPYAVWLSEIMLQQTTVGAVRPYFQAFMARWPSLRDLAAAGLDDVLVAWQGLGYYSRARHLHACAQRLVGRHAGQFPDDEAHLLELPGVGAYTAAAIAAIAFGRPVVPVDGNVVRVLSRLGAVPTPMPRARGKVAVLAQAFASPIRAGDFAQALMDLGATVCLPRRPRCSVCPWRGDCRAFGEGRPDGYPIRAPLRPRPERRGVAFWVERSDGAVLLRRRPDRGLLGGMMEVPTTAWREEPWSDAEAAGEAPVAATWSRLAGTVRHTFTHFHLELTVLAGRVGDGAEADGVWCRPARFAEQALPTVMKKVARHAGLAAPASGRANHLS